MFATKPEEEWISDGSCDRWILLKQTKFAYYGVHCKREIEVYSGKKRWVPRFNAVPYWAVNLPSDYLVPDHPVVI